MGSKQVSSGPSIRTFWWSALAGQLEGLALLWLLDRERLRIGETARESVRLALVGLRPDSARAPGPP